MAWKDDDEFKKFDKIYWKLNLVDTVANSLVKSVKVSDLIIICTPLSTYPKIINEMIQVQGKLLF